MKIFDALRQKYIPTVIENPYTADVVGICEEAMDYNTYNISLHELRDWLSKQCEGRTDILPLFDCNGRCIGRRVLCEREVDAVAVKLRW